MHVANKDIYLWTAKAKKEFWKNVDHSSKMEHSFLFFVWMNTVYNGMLVDCDVTTCHNRWVNIHNNVEPQNHFIQLADSCRTNNIVLKKGNSCVSLMDLNWNIHRCVLKETFLSHHSNRIFFLYSWLLTKVFLINLSRIL